MERVDGRNEGGGPSLSPLSRGSNHLADLTSYLSYLYLGVVAGGLAYRSRNDLGLLLAWRRETRTGSPSYALRIRGHDGIHSHGRISSGSGNKLGEVVR